MHLTCAGRDAAQVPLARSLNIASISIPQIDLLDMPSARSNDDTSADAAGSASEHVTDRSDRTAEAQTSGQGCCSQAAGCCFAGWRLWLCRPTRVSFAGIQAEVMMSWTRVKRRRLSSSCSSTSNNVQGAARACFSKLMIMFAYQVPSLCC